MKNIYSLILLFAIMVSGCSQDEVVKEQPSPSEPLIFTASFEDKNSRTYLNEDEHLCWTANDLISIFAANTYNQKYEFQGKTGANSGDFEAVTSNSYQTGNDLSRHYAIYPYNSSSTITENGVITAILPAEQSYAVKSFGLGANTMVAATADKNDKFLKFKNVGGYLELNLYGNDVTVKSITLQGNSNEKIAGSATITPIYNGNPTVEMANNATNTITLDCGAGVKIGSTAETATAFWMVIPPTTFEKGFTITITDINGSTFTKSTSKSIEIERNVIQSMSGLEVDTTPYVTFKAEAVQSLKMSMEVKTLEYSVNGSDWETLGVKTVEFGGILGNLRLRGKSSMGTATTYQYYAQIKFTEDVKVSCTGNILTLVNYLDYKNANTTSAKFCYLFADCGNLIEAPSLPIENLAKWCYYSMFKNCSSLKEAPILPAKIMTELCYTGMFEGCTNLTIAPELPAEVLAKQCYAKMFANCSKLIVAPTQLPATVLTQGCYQWMFQDCINLNEVPQLSAEELDENSCYQMFEGCTNLTIAPELPAEVLAKQCYYGMFANTGLIKTPNLPAKILASSCYKYMFWNCKNLTEIQEMSAEILADECYASMFKGCVSISNPPELPITTLADFCYHSMFMGCVNLTTPPTLPATILANSCYSLMFGGCTSLTKSPDLLAPKLVQSCYTQMFEGCTNLNNITMTATDISANSCLGGWVSNVSPIGTFIKANTMYSLPKGTSGIPSEWTVKNYSK